MEPARHLQAGIKGRLLQLVRFKSQTAQCDDAARWTDERMNFQEQRESERNELKGAGEINIHSIAAEGGP